MSKSFTLTKKFQNISCRNCGEKMRVFAVCLDCNEPTEMDCSFCFGREQFIHKGHEVLRL